MVDPAPQRQPPQLQSKSISSTKHECPTKSETPSHERPRAQLSAHCSFGTVLSIVSAADVAEVGTVMSVATGTNVNEGGTVGSVAVTTDVNEGCSGVVTGCDNVELLEFVEPGIWCCVVVFA